MKRLHQSSCIKVELRVYASLHFWQLYFQSPMAWRFIYYHITSDVNATLNPFQIIYICKLLFGLFRNKNNEPLATVQPLCSSTKLTTKWRNWETEDEEELRMKPKEVVSRSVHQGASFKNYLDHRMRIHSKGFSRIIFNTHSAMPFITYFIPPPKICLFSLGSRYFLNWKNNLFGDGFLKGIMEK